MTQFFRVRDKDTGHEFTEGFFDPDIHERVDESGVGPDGVPLPPKPNTPAVTAATAAGAAGEPLRGAALDAALDAAGLSKSGTVHEKRARLAETTPTEV